MGLRKDLAEILARDPRYSIHIYQFVMDALQDLEAKRRRQRGKLKRPDSLRGKPKPTPSKSRVKPQHVTGQILCEAVRDLALRQYGMMGLTVLSHWGVKSTSNIGDVVYNLIEAGDLQKNEGDSRSDFDDVFDFTETFGRLDLVAIDDEA